MSELMRKILYYENILEFKENTRTALRRSEVNNWRLCPTCLEDVRDCGKYVLLGLEGNLLTSQQMLDATGTIHFAKKDQPEFLPMSICKNCLNKVSAMYFFKLQTKRAAEVLKRLMAKLHEADAVDKAEEEQQEMETTTNDMNAKDCTSRKDESLLNDECASTTQLVDSSKAPHLAIEQTPTEEENELAEVEDEEEDEYDELAEKSYVEIDEEEAFDEVIKQEEIQSNKSRTENDYEDEDDVAIDSMEQEFYLDDENSCSNSNDAVSNTWLTQQHHEISTILQNTKSDHEKDDLANVKAKQEVLVTTHCKRDSKASKRKRSVAKFEKPLLENLKCIVCNKEFGRLRLLTDHVQRDHPTAKAFKCRVCGNKFAHMQSLSRHMRTHRSFQYKYVCDKVFCGKEFIRPDDLRRHLRVHTGERPYQCVQCPKAFKQPSELKEHQRSHSNEKLFKCDICDHRLSSRNGLYVHKKAHTNVKNFICVHCEKRFLTNGELKSHTKIHFKTPKVD